MALNLCASPKCKLVATPSMFIETPSPSSRLLLPPLGSSSSKSSNNIKNTMACVTTLTSVHLRKSTRLSVRCSLETAGPTVTVGKVTEVNKDTFWPIVHAAEDKTVVLDMFTQWCGPCKVIAPKFEELSGKYLDVVFLKLDCNNDNRPLAKELGIKVVPTFKILKNKKVVKEVTGAKVEDLVAAIEAVRSAKGI